MSDNIYEITKMMQDKKNVQKDMQEAFSLVSKMFHDKYTNKIYKVLQEKQNQVEKNPSKEVNLLKAIKPFLHKSNHKHLDKTIKAIILKDTLNSIQLETATIKNKENITKDISIKSNKNFINDSSIHSDGVYDIDTSCLKNSTNNFNNNFLDNLILLVLFNIL